MGKAFLIALKERRLMYVAITRAQRTLVVAHAAKRKKGREMRTAAPSRFIEEMQLGKADAQSHAPVSDRLAKLRAALKSSTSGPEAQTL